VRREKSTADPDTEMMPKAPEGNDREESDDDGREDDGYSV
jgi:hypothetical protein